MMCNCTQGQDLNVSKPISHLFGGVSMAASEKVQEIALRLEELNAEEKSQLFMLVPSLWEEIPVEKLLTQLFQEEEVIRHGKEYRLDITKQKQLSQLLEKNRQKTLVPAEEAEMDQLIEESEDLTLLKAQALYTVKLLAKRLS